MSEEIQLLKKREHQVFADLLLAGHDAATAYGLAGFAAKTPSARAVGASRMLKNANVAAYLEAKRRVMEKAADIDKTEAVMMAVKILRSAPSEASLDNPLCEVRHTSEGPKAVFPSKAKMMDRLAKMLGWDMPEKVEVDGVQELAKVLANMRNEPRPRK